MTDIEGGSRDPGTPKFLVSIFYPDTFVGYRLYRHWLIGYIGFFFSIRRDPIYPSSTVVVCMMEMTLVTDIIFNICHWIYEFWSHSNTVENTNFLFLVNSPARWNLGNAMRLFTTYSSLWMFFDCVPSILLDEWLKSCKVQETLSTDIMQHGQVHWHLSQLDKNGILPVFGPVVPVFVPVCFLPPRKRMQNFQ